MSEIIPDISVSNETSLDSVGSMLVNVFVSPMRVFQRLKVKSTWIVPFIIFVLATAATSYVIAPLAMETQRKEILSSEKYSQEQKDAAIKQMESFAGFGQAIGVVGGLIGAAIMVFLSAGIVMFMGTVVFGGAAKYMQLVAVVCFAQLPSVLGQIIKTPLMAAKHTMDIRTSLAVLLPGGDIKSLAYFFLNTLTDVFFIWEILLMIAGVMVVYNFAKGKASAAILIPVGVIMAVVGVLKAVL